MDTLIRQPGRPACGTRFTHNGWRTRIAAALLPMGASVLAACGATQGGRVSATSGSAAITRVRVIGMSDFHAALRTRPDANGRTMGGAVALSAAIVRAQRECTGDCVSVVVNAGDLFTGTPASDWDSGRPTVAVINRMDVAAGALGNHEFDFGQDTLRLRLRELHHAVLGVNVRGPDGQRPAWLRADTMVVRGGVRIGIVGAAGEHTPGSTKRRNLTGLTFLPPGPLISERVRALRAAGAQVVVSVIHDGARCERDQPTVCHGEGFAIAQALTDRPDVFVMGHSHVNLDLRVGMMPVVEPTSNGRGIVVVDVPLDGSAPRSEIRDVPGDSVSEADSRVDSIVRTAVAKVQSRLERPVATIAAPLARRGEQYALGNLIADAARAAGSADFAVWNNGGIRADLQAGPLTYGGVHEVSPFGNVLVRVRLRGRDVRSSAESWVAAGRADAHVSGMTVEYDPTRPRGSRVMRVLLPDGKAVEDSTIYTLVLNDFMIDDGDGFGPKGIISQEFLNVRDIDSLASYLERQPQPVVAPAEPRIRAVRGGAR